MSARESGQWICECGVCSGKGIVAVRIVAGRFWKELCSAASEGDARGVRIALAAGADPRLWDEDCRTALMFAAYGGNPECVRLLLPLSDPDACDSSGYTALKIAVQYGRGDCVPDLAKASDTGLMLMWALLHGHGHDWMVETLLPHCDPRETNADGKTVLMQAAEYGRLSVMESLLPVSDVLAKDKSGKTALDYSNGKCADLILAALAKREMDGLADSTAYLSGKGRGSAPGL